MRTSAEDRPLPPCPASPLSITITRPALRRARWKAIEAPMTPAPRMTMSAVRVSLTSCSRFSLVPEVPEDLVGGVVPRRAGHPAAGMGARAAQVEPADGRAVLRPPRDRAHEEELLQRQVAVEDVPLGEAVGALEVERRQDLPRLDRPRHVRRVPPDDLHHAVAEELAVLVPGPLPQPVRDVLHEAGQDLLAPRGQRVVHGRGQDAVDPQIVRELAELGAIVAALRELERGD